jgi:hypothetical protein
VHSPRSLHRTLVSPLAQLIAICRGLDGLVGSVPDTGDGAALRPRCAGVTATSMIATGPSLPIGAKECGYIPEMTKKTCAECRISSDWTHLISPEWDHRPEPLFNAERRGFLRRPALWSGRLCEHRYVVFWGSRVSMPITTFFSAEDNQAKLRGAAMALIGV